MSTPQTGGGNGAAPDGGTGQPCIVPDKPGWWWGIPKTWNEDRETQAIRVAQSPYSNDLLASGLASVGVWLEDVEWLAPIYGPAVCAALAEYGEALAGLDDSTRLPSDVLGIGNRVTVGQAIQDFELSKARLTDAIRAERDAERDGGA